MPQVEIEFYRTEKGECPTEDFLDSLDDKMAAKMLRAISYLAANGYELREPVSKVLEDGILEIRARQGSDITRALYFFTIGNKAVITHGFVKKTQKTPRDQIEKAKKYRVDYKMRNNLK